MLTERFAVVMRSILLIAGAGGFVLGLTLSWWNGASLAMALFRGTFLCATFAFLARFLLLHLFRAYIRQLQLRAEAAAAAAATQKTS